MTPPRPGTPRLVIGVGNEFRGDDGVGPAVIDRLLEHRFHGVTLRKATLDGAALMASWKGIDHVILVDAMVSGCAPGSIRRIDAHRDPIPVSCGGCSTHALGLADMVEMARVLGELPGTLVIFGIEGRSFDPGAGLTPELERARDRMVELLTQELSSDPRERRRDA